MKREEVEAATGRPISDDEWALACSLLNLIDSHPDADAVLTRCAERGLSVQETIAELLKRPPSN